MLPLRDENRSGSFPIVTVSIIVGCAAVFLYELSLGQVGLKQFIDVFALTPGQVTYGLHSGDAGLPRLLAPFFTSMFLHGGWLHLIGNMWFLWIFGDNVEDRFGHVRFLLFYLVGGVTAGLTHVLLNPGSEMPTIGASGAVAAVLGAYWFLYPRARVLTLVPAGFFIQTAELPAKLFLAIWFGLQFLSAGIVALTRQETGAGAVAWWAHIGGFLFGYLVAVVFYRSQRRELEAW
jgi:membrane associated rhomboid family serine protease